MRIKKTRVNHLKSTSSFYNPTLSKFIWLVNIGEMVFIACVKYVFRFLRLQYRTREYEKILQHSATYFVAPLKIILDKKYATNFKASSFLKLLFLNGFTFALKKMKVSSEVY
ncbi:hypothetical protein BpHYR1_022294 [Brachionus plicatilis]|uniref:Uncharacterized protein n=1 Tax=Brachionus plicatilis TaxID=10195 RepID=A0A3M7PNY6_BRAPC|nr:hypothetical protein BpHYR1_022294 [Brachionus plicatilis]